MLPLQKNSFNPAWFRRKEHLFPDKINPCNMILKQEKNELKGDRNGPLPGRKAGTKPTF
jgi:hypothetical protein